METLYDWLLHNTGNAGNYYTILNTQRDESDGLEIMARLPDFTVVNLLVSGREKPDSEANPSNKTSANQYGFSNEQQVIRFLIDGKTPESNQPDLNISILVNEPDGEAGAITFPPTQP